MSRKKTGKILFVEDDKDMQESFKAFFQAKGYRLHCVSRGEEGIKCAIDNCPDVIILDLLLPGMDGAEVCRRIKDNKKTRHIPIILYSGVRRSMGINITRDDYKWLPADKVVDKCNGYESLLDTILELGAKKK